MNLIVDNVTYRCKMNDISFSPLIEGNLLDRFDNFELYNLMNNIFDNAINYEKTVKDTSLRYIKMTVKRIGNFCVIKQINYIENPDFIKFNNDGTIKSNERSNSYEHGLGTRSIFMFAKKYDGNANYKLDNNELILTLTFPL